MSAPPAKKQYQPLPLEFVDMVASVVYTPENIERAAAYIRGRGVDPTSFRLPWAMSSDDKRPWEFVRQWDRYPGSYTERLYIPIADIRYDPKLTGKNVLAGFDIRYCGSARQNKYMKLKRVEKDPMLYNLHEAYWDRDGNPQKWAVWVESALDTEVIRSCGIPVVGALSAIGSPNFAALMFGLFEMNYIMYDNDDGGRTATKRLLDAADRVGPEVRRAFSQITFAGKDATAAKEMFGLDYLRTTIRSQVMA